MPWALDLLHSQVELGQPRGCSGQGLRWDAPAPAVAERLDGGITLVGKPPLILLPAVFSVQWVPDGSHVNHAVLGQGQSGPVLTHWFSSALPHPHAACAGCSGHQHPWGSCSAHG